MLAVAIVLLVVAAALGVLLVRANARLSALGEDLSEAQRLRQAAEEARAEAEAGLAEAEAAASGVHEQAAALWELALGGVRRTWEVSVAPSPGAPSPLDGSDDELRDAIAIEVDAAREEAGAAIELAWDANAVVGPALAVRALALVQEIVGRLAKATDPAALQVTVRPDSVTVAVSGTDLEGAPASVEDLLADVAPQHQAAPGRFELT